ncbi:hypothetical protein EVAR_41794_1 [Eumeta japonica]|uniref:Uncharacterized protein n=1 Tax=Eumeta variegata TaxID=151549 RepID=A0A4C1W1F3_EUMVA|nr:hypothetical protein EVAR_41794_1 [Eumeta japonica]
MTPRAPRPAPRAAQPPAAANVRLSFLGLWRLQHSALCLFLICIGTVSILRYEIATELLRSFRPWLRPPGQRMFSVIFHTKRPCHQSQASSRFHSGSQREAQKDSEIVESYELRNRIATVFSNTESMFETRAMPTLRGCSEEIAQFADNQIPNRYLPVRRQHSQPLGRRRYSHGRQGRFLRNVLLNISIARLASCLYAD